MRIEKWPVLIAVLALVAAVATPAVRSAGASATSVQGPLQAELKASLTRDVDRIAASVDGVVGYAITDLTTGDRVAARLETEPFPTASTIKLSILYELFKQAGAGKLAIDTPMPLDRAQVAGGSGVLQHLTTPSLSLRDHAALMIILSDNTSTNVVINAVGMEKVNERAASLGMTDIRLRRLMMDAAAVKRGEENVASPASLARSAEVLWKGVGLDQAGKDAALGILRLVGGQIRGAVPSAVTVYSKTGSLDGVRAEAAVVDVPGRPFSIAVMTTYLKQEAEGNRAIHEMAAAAYAYFDRLAKGGAYGRR
jgi:beta-lactamase class A